MAASALLATKWSRLADLNPADKNDLDTSFGLTGGTDLANQAQTTPTGKIANGGMVSTANGYYCLFNLDGGTDEDYTHPFDWPVTGDFTITVNSLASNLPSNTTIDVSVQGSVDGEAWGDLQTDIIDGLAICDSGAGVVVSKVYDLDGKGKMPFMRLQLTSASNHSDESIMIHIFPH